MKRSVRIILSILLVAALGLLPACGAGEDEETPTPRPTPTSQPTPEPVEPGETSQVMLYFTRGESLGAAGREVQTEGDVESRAAAALEALLAGPTAEEEGYGLGTVIPDGTKLNDVAISGDTITVDMSRQYESGGGSLSMLLRVAQIVYTATQFDGVTKVAFKLDGAVAKAIGGEGIVVEPSVTRADFEGQLPPIFVEVPVPGQTVASPVAVSGSANVFEAQFRVKVLGPDDKTLADEAVMATSGTGTRGTFEASIAFTTTSAGDGSLVFYEPSAKDGSPINVVEIPVKLEK